MKTNITSKLKKSFLLVLFIVSSIAVNATDCLGAFNSQVNSAQSYHNSWAVACNQMDIPYNLACNAENDAQFDKALDNALAEFNACCPSC